MDKSDAEKIAKILKISSTISQLEIPTLLLGALAFIPGIIDETFFGIGAIAVYAAIAIGRRYLINHKEEYLLGLKTARAENKISEEAYIEAVKNLNTLTVEGGKKS